MIKTRLTELVGLKYPIIQAGMGPYPVTSLCIAAANAGCLGLCSTFATTSRETNPIVFEDFCKQAHAETTDDDVTIFKKMFTRVFEETKESDGIFGANVMVSAEVKANAMKVMQAIKELREADPEMKRRFRVLVTTAGDPMPWANFVKEQGGEYRYFKKVLNGKPLYVITYGNFANRDAALTAIKALPAKVQAGKPWARTVTSVQQELPTTR